MSGTLLIGLGVLIAETERESVWGRHRFDKMTGCRKPGVSRESTLLTQSDDSDGRPGDHLRRENHAGRKENPGHVERVRGGNGYCRVRDFSNRGQFWDGKTPTRAIMKFTPRYGCIRLNC